MTFRSKTLAGFGLALAILIAVCVLSYRKVNGNVEDRTWVTHTYVVMEKLDAARINLIDVESGQRGYILTGDESFLTNYYDGLAQIHKNLKDVRELTSDNPVQQRNLDLLEPSVEVKLKELRNRINLREKAGMRAAAEDFAAGADADRTHQLRAQLANMRGEEERLLMQRSAELDLSSRATGTVIVAGDALALLFLFLAAIVVRQEIERRARAEEGVRELNAGLEKRVAERTEELAERARDLARSNSELQQFAYVASHDLQEPLRMVASFTQLLAKRYGDKLDDDARDFINYAVDGATRMQTLISDLLSYSRVGTQARPFESTDCDAVLERVLVNLRLAIDESGATIVQDPLPVVLGDPQQIGQLFQNLIANAIKFRGTQPPCVQIHAQRHGSDWCISIRDNGIGVAPEQADRIFVIFQRLHTKTEYPGTGIGLAVCKKIVERHGGRIWVESNPGAGSAFCFTLPAAPKTEQQGEKKHDELRTPVSAR